MSDPNTIRELAIAVATAEIDHLLQNRPGRIRLHEFRQSGWEYAPRPNSPNPCGACGRDEKFHPYVVGVVDLGVAGGRR